MIIATQSDPFQPFDLAKKPHVPEPSTYGFILLALMIAIILYRRNKKS